MSTLVREGYARFEPSTKRYTLGLQSFRLSHRVSHERALIDVARPTMEEVSNTTREATLLSVLDGPYQLYVHYAKGPQQVSVIGEPGRRGPLHCTAMGKCLVAFAPRALRDDLVENLVLTPEGPNTITDREKFRDEIALVRDLRSGARNRHPGDRRPHQVLERNGTGSTLDRRTGLPGRRRATTRIPAGTHPGSPRNRRATARPVTTGIAQ
jgi:DNA-binding IclR family transcriptional regulator